MNKILIIFIIVCIQAQAFAILDPDSEEMEEANKAFKNKNYPKALEQYKSLNEKFHMDKKKEKESISHYNAANTLYTQKRYKEALQEYYQALEGSDPQMKSKILNNMGNSYANAGQYPKALDAYLQALKSNPNHKQTRRNIERLFQLQKQKQQQQQNNKDSNSKKKESESQKQEEQNKNKNNQENEKQDNNYDSTSKKQKASDMEKELAKKFIEQAAKNKVNRQMPFNKKLYNELKGKPY